MTTDIGGRNDSSGWEIHRRLEKIETALDTLPERLAQTYIRQDLHGVVHDYLNGEITGIRNELKEAAKERVASRRFRITTAIAFAAAVIAGLIGLAASLH